MGKSGHVNHLDPKGLELIGSHIDCLEWFVRFVWDNFFFRFQGSNYEVARAFAKKFDGYTAHVGDLTLHVIDKLIVTTTKLPTDGKRWFRNKIIIGKYIIQSLKV